jgi:hypothetical protein
MTTKVLVFVACVALVAFPAFSDEIDEMIHRAGIKVEERELPLLPLTIPQINQAIQREIELVREQEGRDAPVPPENEVVMSPGMKITATTSKGTMTITAGKGLH